MLAPAILLLALSIVKVTSVSLRNDATNSTLHKVDHAEYVNETQRQHNKTWQSSTTAALSEHTKSDPNSSHPSIPNSNPPSIPNFGNPPIPNSNPPPIPNLTNLWEEGIIPFVIDGNFTTDGKALLLDAMIQWQTKTCVVFVDKTREHKDYVVFTKLPCGCCASVGNLRTGPQLISIGHACEQTGIVLHELGHVIGLSDLTDDSTQASPKHQDVTADRTQASPRHQDKLINVSHSVNGSDPGNTTKTLASLVNQTMDVNITHDKMNATDTKEEKDDSISENDSIMRYGEKLFQSKLYSNHPNEVKYVESADFLIKLKMKIYLTDVKATNELYRCPKCGKSFQRQEGNVTYLPSTNASDICQWRIIAGYGEIVLLKITGVHFNGSCDDTYLEIRDGPSKSSALLEKLCAGDVPLSVTSTGPLMFIEYRSKTGLGKGFEGDYIFVCGGEITVEDKVYLASPNYPYEYMPDKNCSWKLSVEKGFRIVLKLELFKLEGSENCKSDYLEVRDGATAASKLFGRYCSHSIPSVFMSTGEHLLVTFVSDGFYQTDGFLGNVVREKIK